MGDEREPLSSEELIRRARGGFSESEPERVDNDEPSPVYDGEPTFEPGPEASPRPEPVLTYEPAEDPDPRAADASPHDPGTTFDTARPETYSDEASAGGSNEDAATLDRPSWLPDTTYPGGTMPRPGPSGVARFFSIGRWVLGGVFLLVALGQCVGSETTLDSLVIGECFQDPGLGIEVAEVETVDCNDLHDFELYATVSLGSSERVFPGSETLFTELESECVARFPGYVGNDYFTSAYDFVAFTPVADGWRDGDRAGMCAIYEFGPAFEIVQSIGTARNSGR